MIGRVSITDSSYSITTTTNNYFVISKSGGNKNYILRDGDDQSTRISASSTESVSNGKIFYFGPVY